MSLAEEWKGFKSYLRDNIIYICAAAVIITAVYGIRAFRSSFCIDSEIMISQPDYMKSIWLGSNRFGMYIINEIFDLQRLSPFLSGFLMMITMWVTAVVLGYICRIWTGEVKGCRIFSMLFPLLTVTSPLFAEQYLFVLQAFEISVGLLLTVIAVYCADRAIRAIYTMPIGRVCPEIAKQYLKAKKNSQYTHTEKDNVEFNCNSTNYSNANVGNDGHTEMTLAQLGGGGIRQRMHSVYRSVCRDNKCRNSFRNLSDLCSVIYYTCADFIYIGIFEF